MLVFRLEDSSGMGPYSSSLCTQFEWRLDRPTNNPVPHFDPGLAGKIDEMNSVGFRSFFYGFESMDSLNRWFDPRELERLIYLGFKVMTYECPDQCAYVGHHQVMFLKSRSVALKENVVKFPVWGEPKLMEAS